ncbi:putative LRR receptor-like serine/threonine-protein kinase isoform X1 [Cinnamomum micranthum f. kanehirae]|uniref:Putative LRR receptor-like serine/threonine-protein kinase isoform X1 n=1 Tax=Cinnamomum micranthum f. kanehirae TaxID=337451 RepID=A0A443PCY3_9MAGN|nr:putative LRR receptor-like serine/threonine-protein kinase isoform X1 [Cinnamomum micranthum f. kanehirae]
MLDVEVIGQVNGRRNLERHAFRTAFFGISYQVVRGLGEQAAVGRVVQMISLLKMKKLLLGSPSVTLLSICFWCVVNLLRLVELSQAQNATNRTTDPSEVSALNSIFQKWGVSAPLSTWNTTGDPCTGTAVNSQSIGSDSFNPAIKCLCNFNNGTTCHITQMPYQGLANQEGKDPINLKKRSGNECALNFKDRPNESNTGIVAHPAKLRLRGPSQVKQGHTSGNNTIQCLIVLGSWYAPSNLEISY